MPLFNRFLERLKYNDKTQTSDIITKIESACDIKITRADITFKNNKKQYKETNHHKNKSCVCKGTLVWYVDGHYCTNNKCYANTPLWRRKKQLILENKITIKDLEEIEKFKNKR